MSRPLAVRSLCRIVPMEIWFEADEHGCMQLVRLPDGRVYEFYGSDRGNMKEREERRKDREESKLHGLQTSLETPVAKLGW